MASNCKTMPIDVASVPRIFNVERSGEICARDIVAVVRGSFEPNPWTPVVLEIKGKGAPVAVGELAESAIYWKGVNDTSVGSTVGISVHSYFVVDSTSLDPDAEDCGINVLSEEFRSRYEVQSFDILVTGDKANDVTTATLLKLKDYLLSAEREDIIFPAFIVERNKLRADGYDISPIAAELGQARQRNALDYTVLDSILARMSKDIIPGSTVIQDIRGLRTKDVKVLTMYYTLKYNLPPAYVPSFIAEYIQFPFVYPRTQLSLYERISFLHRLPLILGYIGNNQSFNCLAKVQRKIYPAPHYIFDLESHTVLPESEMFALDTPGCHFADYRSMFPGSKFPIMFGPNTDNKSIAQVSLGQDNEADRRLVDLFYELEQLVTDEQVFLSIKNSVLVERNGRRYILYCPEECGLHVVLLSEFFYFYEHIITEGEFGHIIDAQIERALLQRDHAPNPAAGNTALITTWKKIDPSLAIHPAIPLEVSLNMFLLPAHRNGLSFYDSLLRCHQDVLPIITSHDSPLRDVSKLFEEVPMKSLREDPQARYAISSFGTLTAYSAQDPQLPLTYKAFKQGGLL